GLRDSPMPRDGTFARTWQIILAVFGVLGFALALREVDAYLDRKIDTRMSDPAFIRQVASQVRPALIFDSNGSILADLGAMQYFDEITVKFPDMDNKPGEIVLKPKILLTYPPDISGIGGIQISPVARRGPGFTWYYRVGEILMMKEKMPRPFRGLSL